MRLRSTSREASEQPGAGSAWARWEPLRGSSLSPLIVASLFPSNAPNGDPADQQPVGGRSTCQQ
jgi:hypothetical protein